MRVRLDIDSIFSVGVGTLCEASTGGAVVTGVTCVVVSIIGGLVTVAEGTLGAAIMRAGFAGFAGLSGGGGELDVDTSNETSRIR